MSKLTYTDKEAKTMGFKPTTIKLPVTQQAIGIVKEGGNDDETFELLTPMVAVPGDLQWTNTDKSDRFEVSALYFDDAGNLIWWTMPRELTRGDTIATHGDPTIATLS